MMKTRGIKKEKAVRVLFAAAFVLLAAVCVFAGAGAAVDDENADPGGVNPSGENSDIKTYYAYVPYDKEEEGIDAGVKWWYIDEHGYVTAIYISSSTVSGASDKFYFSPTMLDKEGLYMNDEEVTVKVLFPTIRATGQIYKDDKYIGLLSDAFVPKDKDAGYKIRVQNVLPAEGADYVCWELINVASGETTQIGVNTDGYLTKADSADLLDLSVFENGDYVLQPYFKDGYLVPGSGDFKYGDAIPFTLGKGNAGITLSTDEVPAGYMFIATVTGLPGVEYTVTVQKDVLSAPEQKGVTIDGNKATFTMPAAGVFDLTLKAEKKANKAMVSLSAEGVEEYAYVDVLDGIITAEADKTSYLIGEDITLTGTNSTAGKLYFYFEGPNVQFTQIMKGETPITVSGSEWNATITYEDIRNSVGHDVEAGSYLIRVSPINGGDKETVISDVYAAVEVPLKITTINITSVRDVFAQGEDIVVKGEAPGVKSVIWYLIGIEYFEAGVEKVVNNTYTITIDKQYTCAEKMYAGQYFLIVQSPMYDGLYSVAPEKMAGMWGGEGTLDKEVHSDYILESDQSGIYKFTIGQLAKADGYDSASKIIYPWGPQSGPNSAQALCDALNSEQFDDLYAKTSIIVGAPVSIIDLIPSKITRGEILPISGTTTGHVGDIVAIDFLSTAFAAVPKEAVGTAEFVTVTTKVLDDGTWKIFFDTSALNVDEYDVSVQVGDLPPATTKLIVADGPVAKRTYKLTDHESVSGGPLHISKKIIVVHNPAGPESTVKSTQNSEKECSGTGSSVWLTDDTEFKPGDSVMARMDVSIPKGSLTNSDWVSLATSLIGASWTVSVSISADGHIVTKHFTRQRPLSHLYNFDIDYDCDVVLHITLTGYVPSGDIEKLSVMNVFTTATGGDGVKSYNVLMKPSQSPIYDDKLTLYNGWNFISVPKKLATSCDTAGELFSGVDTGGKSILSYNAQTKQWAQVTPSTVISPLNAYWIYSTGKHILTPAFDTAPSVPAVKNVYTGWNAVGISAENAMTAKDAFNGVDWRTFLLWDAENQKTGTIYNKGGSGAYSDEQFVPLYKGGWFYVNEDGTLIGYTQ